MIKTLLHSSIKVEIVNGQEIVHTFTEWEHDIYERWKSEIEAGTTCSCFSAWFENA